MFRNVFKTGIRGTYAVLENASFSTDPWLVYPAKHKTTGKVVSVFIFDKARFEATLARICANNSREKSPRVVASECYELLKFEVSQQARLKHPQVLTVLEVLEETKTKLLFVTEAVTDTLITLEGQLDDLSIQKGLLEVSKGLQFLHRNCNTVHFNLQPSSVYINSQGDWKLAGFRFLKNLNDISPSERNSFYIMSNSLLVPFANMNVNYTAPELLVDSESKLEVGNDMWSLGCVIYFLYNREQLINCYDNDSISDFKQEFRKFSGRFYNHPPSELRYLLKNIPDALYPLFPQLLARYPHDRLTIDQFIDSSFFDGSLIKAMWFVDEFSTKTLPEKLIFMDAVLNGDDLLKKFPASFKGLKLLPLLVEMIGSELLVLTASKPLNSDTDKLLTDALTIVFKIGSELSGLTFQDRIYEPLLSTSKLRKAESSPFALLIGVSVKIRLTIVANLEVLETKLKAPQLVELVKQLSNLALTTSPAENNNHQTQIQMQDTFLGKLAAVAEKIDFPYIKNSLFPLICQVFKTTTVLSTKIATISTFEGFVSGKIVDRAIVTEQLLPVLQNLKSRDKRIVGPVLQFLFKLSESEHVALDIDVVVDSVLSQALKLVFGCNDCTQQEFDEFVGITNQIQAFLVKQRKRLLVEGEAKGTDFELIINTPKETPMAKHEVMQTTNFGSSKSVPKKPALPLALNRNTVTNTRSTIRPSAPSAASLTPSNRTAGGPTSSNNPLASSNSASTNLGSSFSPTNSSFSSNPTLASLGAFSMNSPPLGSSGSIYNLNMAAKNAGISSSPLTFGATGPNQLNPAQKAYPPGYNSTVLTPSTR